MVLVQAELPSKTFKADDGMAAESDTQLEQRAGVRQSRGVQGGAATGWLTTLAPIKAGSVITLRLALWDTGDSELDSTVLIDRCGWSIEEPSAPTTTPTPVLL